MGYGEVGKVLLMWEILMSTEDSRLKEFCRLHVGIIIILLIGENIFYTLHYKHLTKIALTTAPVMSPRPRSPTIKFDEDCCSWGRTLAGALTMTMEVR